METLFFLLPVCAVVAILVFAIARVNSGSYLRRRVEAQHPSKTTKVEPAREVTASDRMEQRYVDWFTADRTTRLRDRALRGQDGEVLMEQAITTGGLAYQPSESAPRVLH
jgi:hypothetical protein